MSREKPRFERQNPKLPVPVNNVYRVKLTGFIENQMTLNTFYFRDALALGTANETHMGNLLTGLFTSGGFVDKYRACMSSDWVLNFCVIDCPTSPSLAALTQTVISFGTGTAGHEPTEVAFNINRYTGFKGQCGRGRVLMPAVPTSVVTASKVTTLTAYTAFANQMLAPIAQGGDTFTPGLYSRDGSHAFPGAGYADLTATLTQASSLLGTARRRKIGRGK